MTVVQLLIRLTGDEMKDRLRALQETLNADIPMTKHLGITVDSYDAEGLTLNAPFKANSNQKKYAFAGSLNSLVTLAGWGQLWLVLQELDMTAEIVIQENAIRYLLPVTRDFSARCCKPDLLQIAKFENMLRKKGKARVELHAEIYQGKEVAVAFKGYYVAFLRQPAPRGHIAEERKLLTSPRRRSEEG
jgi:thioesterase domain-containing protein